jgi:hypothetical protein
MLLLFTSGFPFHGVTLAGAEVRAGNGNGGIVCVNNSNGDDSVDSEGDDDGRWSG